MIEGNQLTEKEVAQAINEGKHFPDRERNEKEVLSYYVALDEVEKLGLNIFATVRYPVLKKQDLKH